MEEGREMAWESIERGVKGRGCEVWKMEEGGEEGQRQGLDLRENQGGLVGELVQEF